MAHVKPLGGEGFVCPAPKIKVVPVTNEDIEHWKNKCLHKLDISVLDERKFELQVTFPDNFETHFTIIRRDKSEDHMLFPSCIFEKIDFFQKGEIKMWIATREEDGKRLPIAVSAPSWEESRCILNDDDRLYYFFC
ncbi:hypothetical protein O0L34_g11022 [Tuta absoluta]|nr:hypothetical protein O0L34_g11022 [Tuta absoluta]